MKQKRSTKEVQPFIWTFCYCSWKIWCKKKYFQSSSKVTSDIWRQKYGNELFCRNHKDGVKKIRNILSTLKEPRLLLLNLNKEITMDQSSITLELERKPFTWKKVSDFSIKEEYNSKTGTQWKMKPKMKYLVFLPYTIDWPVPLKSTHLDPYPYII